MWITIVQSSAPNFVRCKRYIPRHGVLNLTINGYDSVPCVCIVFSFSVLLLFVLVTPGLVM